LPTGQTHYTSHTCATVEATTRASTVNMVIHRQTLFYRLTISTENPRPEYVKSNRIKRTEEWKIKTRGLENSDPKM